MTQGSPMKPKDDLGKLVKEWRDNPKSMSPSFSEGQLYAEKATARTDCADQLEKVREGKVLVDREKLGKVLRFLQWLGSEGGFEV